MSRVRFRESGGNSFFGQYAYERVVARDHFLVKLGTLVPCERFTASLVAYYKGGAEYGPPPYEPTPPAEDAAGELPLQPFGATGAGSMGAGRNMFRGP